MKKSGETKVFMAVLILGLFFVFPAYGWIDVDSLSADDFFVDSEDMSSIEYLKPYNYNICDWLYATYPGGGGRTFFYADEPYLDREGVIITDRDICLGSTIEEVAEAYGPSLIDTTPTNDALCLKAIQNGWPTLTRMFNNDITCSVSYLYRYEKLWRVGEIIFYFDEDYEACIVYYVTGSWPNSTFLNNRNICAKVQTVLENMGYDCGGVTGVYDPVTRNAISAWQEDEGLTLTGIIDYSMLQELLDEGVLYELLEDLDVAWGYDSGNNYIADTWDIRNQSGSDEIEDSWDIARQSG